MPIPPPAPLYRSITARFEEKYKANPVVTLPSHALSHKKAHCSVSATGDGASNQIRTGDL
jgi:hypothetical protein